MNLHGCTFAVHYGLKCHSYFIKCYIIAAFSSESTDHSKPDFYLSGRTYSVAINKHVLA